MTAPTCNPPRHIWMASTPRVRSECLCGASIAEWPGQEDQVTGLAEALTESALTPADLIAVLRRYPRSIAAMARTARERS